MENLYRRRWSVELYLRHVKTTMGMEVLTCQTPEMIQREFLVGIMAYNLIRAIMLEATLLTGAANERLSFKGTLTTIRQWAPMLEIAMASPKNYRTVIERFMLYIAHDLIPNRPNRVEPRARKRRPKNYPLLNKPRNLYVEIPHRNRYRKAKS